MLFKKTIISAALIGAVVLAIASSGGGKKKAASSLKPEFTPIRTKGAFTLKAGPQFTGSHLISSERSHNFVMYNTIVTYEKGNTIYIFPYQYKSYTGVKSNLSLLDLKIRLHK